MFPIANRQLGIRGWGGEEMIVRSKETCSFIDFSFFVFVFFYSTRKKHFEFMLWTIEKRNGGKRNRGADLSSGWPAQWTRQKNVDSHRPCCAVLFCAWFASFRSFIAQQPCTSWVVGRGASFETTNPPKFSRTNNKKDCSPGPKGAGQASWSLKLIKDSFLC